MSVETDILSIAIVLEGGYLYLVESLQAYKGSYCAAIVLRCSEKPLRRMKLLTQPFLATKRFRTFITFTFVKTLRFGHDKFPPDTQFIGSPVINPLN